jgi:hypothetical protein
MRTLRDPTYQARTSARAEAERSPARSTVCSSTGMQQHRLQLQSQPSTQERKLGLGPQRAALAKRAEAGEVPAAPLQGPGVCSRSNTTRPRGTQAGLGPRAQRPRSGRRRGRSPAAPLQGPGVCSRSNTTRPRGTQAGLGPRAQRAEAGEVPCSSAAGTGVCSRPPRNRVRGSAPDPLETGSGGLLQTP